MENNTNTTEVLFANNFTGVYIGSEQVEDYSKIATIEKGVEVKWNRAIESASNGAIKIALAQAYQASSSSKPKCENLIPTLSIRISAPVEGKHITEKVPAVSLPEGAKRLAITSKEGEQYTIVVMKVIWTARWICLPPGGIEGLPKDGVEPSNGKTFLGNNAYDFGCPHPSKDRIVLLEKKDDHNPLKRSPILANFKIGYRQMEENLKNSLIRTTLSEIETTILQLPKCPPECTPGDLSITLGYPEPYSLEAQEIITMIDKEDYETIDGKFQRVTNKVEQVSYLVKGKWSWSVQKACCQ